MKVYGGVDVWIHIFLTPASRPGRFTPGARAPGTQRTGVWVDLRAGLDDVEKGKMFTLTGLELRPVGSLARSLSLYRLCYPGSKVNV
jgi:hypothetical protein